MCQPKPGPRCSSHARTALDHKRLLRDAAEEASNDARDAFLHGDAADALERERLRQASVDADKAFRAARTAHQQALRDYETTPEGMLSLQEAIERLESSGEPIAAAEARTRWEDAHDIRLRQVADLRLSREHENRLACPTSEELALLDQADADVSAKERAVDGTAMACREAQEHWYEASRNLSAADEAQATAARNVQTAVALAKEARDDAALDAERLYRDAGVSPRFASFYARDMVEAASRTGRGSAYGYPDPYRTEADDQGPVRAMVMKVKRDGPDASRTAAARDAAATDARFVAANARVVQAIHAVEQARGEAAQVREESRSVQEAYQNANRLLSTARYAAEDARPELERAIERRSRLRARIGSGVGTAPTTVRRLVEVRDEIVRNPDGSTNAFVYEAPGDGFPDGRYVRVVGVEQVYAGGQSNALVLENGRRAWSHTTYQRTVVGGRVNHVGVERVVLIPPAAGSVPLRGESVAAGGFATAVDSTD